MEKGNAYVTLSVHVHEDTGMTGQDYPADQRTVLTIGGSDSRVHLFLDVEGLTRLAAEVSASLSNLTGERLTAVG